MLIFFPEPTLSICIMEYILLFFRLKNLRRESLSDDTVFNREDMNPVVQFFRKQYYVKLNVDYSRGDDKSLQFVLNDFGL